MVRGRYGEEYRNQERRNKKYIKIQTVKVNNRYKAQDIHRYKERNKSKVNLDMGKIFIRVCNHTYSYDVNNIILTT